MANLMNYFNIFIWAVIIFHLGFSFANAQVLNDNSSDFSSENEINKIELDYDKKFSELALKKNNLIQYCHQRKDDFTLCLDLSFLLS